MIGVNGRGVVHAQNFAKLANSEVAYICDVDSNVIDKAVKAAAASQTAAIKVIGDFRRALDDKTVDAISIAAPDHWHAPMTLLALKAGKHVYVEKPSGHNPREDELLMEAVKKYKVNVQLGAQRRSGPRFFEALQLVKDGVIGKPYLARAWYANTRQPIGKGKVAPVPSNLDYELWQGPAPRTAVPRQHHPLQLALVHALGHGRDLQQRHARDRRRALAPRRRLSDDRVLQRTAATTSTTTGSSPTRRTRRSRSKVTRSIVWHGQSCNGLPTMGRGAARASSAPAATSSSTRTAG